MEPWSEPLSQNRLMLGRLVAPAFSIVLVSACAASSDTPTPTALTTTLATPAGDGGFSPHTSMEGDSVVMPVTFPDGTTAELVYPPELDLSDMRVQPYSSGYGPGFARDFLILDRPAADVLGEYEEGELLADYDDGHGGNVGFWQLPPDGLFLVFEFGSWTVLVYDYADEGAQMSNEDRALWATNFHGRVADDGFLLLEAQAPLHLAVIGEHAGPELSFWSRADDFKAVTLFPGPCTRYREEEGGFDEIEMVNGLAVSRESDDFAAWCIPHASMTVHVSQKPGDPFIDDVLRGLEVRSVSLASSS
jgi:hypothetical protein